MGSALLNTDTADSTSAPPADSSPAGPNPSLSSHTAALRRQAAERVAAHRNRQAHLHPRATPEPARAANGRSARIAAAVAERYAQSQSYRAFLAAEAERAVQQARAAAEIAALNAQAVAAAQQSLLDTFDQATLDAVPTDATSAPVAQSAAEAAGNQPNRAPADEDSYLFPDIASPEPRHSSAHRHRQPRTSPTRIDPLAPDLQSGPESRATARREQHEVLSVRLYEDASSAAHVDLDTARRTPPPVPRAARPDRNDPEALALDAEIAFRQAPVFEEPPGPPMPLPANLIEFPRQLVAPRKARPRLAEGPLREDAVAESGNGQLRIFEVDPAQISTTPEPEAEDSAIATAEPQWTSIWLDAPAAPATQPVTESGAAAIGEMWAGNRPEPRASQPSAPLPGVATVTRRALAASINGAILFVAIFAFAAVYVAVAAHIVPWHPGPLHTLSARITAATGLQLSRLPAAAAVLTGSLLLLYQMLFFWFSTATPGMRCARIALCTFDDENPTRKTLRRRILALIISACPLGLGFLWAALDEDRLAWHDRLSRTYQRSY